MTRSVGQTKKTSQGLPSKFFYGIKAFVVIALRFRAPSEEFGRVPPGWLRLEHLAPAR
ncbi:protein of unknown function [Desulfovibrio sp. 86]|nr:protein of unknown function [Desulfovibrio sp. 86]